MQPVPQREHHTLPLTRAVYLLMLFEEIILVYVESPSRQIQNAQLLIDNAGGTCSYHHTLEGE
jgi:hypothetical protein